MQGLEFTDSLAFGPAIVKEGLDDMDPLEVDSLLSKLNLNCDNFVGVGRHGSY